MARCRGWCTPRRLVMVLGCLTLLCGGTSVLLAIFVNVNDLHYFKSFKEEISGRYDSILQQLQESLPSYNEWRSGLGDKIQQLLMSFLTPDGAQAIELMTRVARQYSDTVTQVPLFQLVFAITTIASENEPSLEFHVGEHGIIESFTGPQRLLPSAAASDLYALATFACAAYGPPLVFGYMGGGDTWSDVVTAMGLGEPVTSFQKAIVSHTGQAPSELLLWSWDTSTSLGVGEALPAHLRQFLHQYSPPLPEQHGVQVPTHMPPHFGELRSNQTPSTWNTVFRVPSYFVSLRHSERAIILSIRGTLGWADIMTDILANPVPFAAGQVHQGMLAVAHLFNDDEPLRRVLRHAFTVHPTYGIASVLAMHWAHDPNILKEWFGSIANAKRAVPVNATRDSFVFYPYSGTGPAPESAGFVTISRIRAVCFAAPAVMSKDLAQQAAQHALVTTIAMTDDVVPRLSLASLDDLVARILDKVQELPAASPEPPPLATKQPPHLRGSKVSVPGPETDKPAPPPQPKQSNSTDTGLAKRRFHLYPPGRLLVLHLCVRPAAVQRPGAECHLVMGVMVCAAPTHVDALSSSRCVHALAEAASASIGDAIVLTQTMFINHFPNRYERALRRISRQQA